MELVELRDIEPLPKVTPVEVEEFLEKHTVEMLNFMGDTSIHPIPLVALHAIQVGLPYNIIVWRQNPKSPELLINANYIVRDEKDVKSGFEVSDSIKENNVRKVFLTNRSTKILGLVENYTDATTPLEKGNKEYEGEASVLFQQLADLSQGKMISRFPEVIEEDEETVEEVK